MIRKAIIPSALWEDDFYPMNVLGFKESLPVGDVVLVDLLLKELLESEIEEAVFILSEQKKMVAEYLKSFQKSLTEDQKQKNKEKLTQMKISISLQKFVESPIKSILKTKNFLRKNDDFAVVGYEEFFLSKEPALRQLLKIFETAKKPVIGLWRVKEPINGNISGVEVAVEKIANRLYKVKKLRKISSTKEGIPEFLLTHRYIFTPELRETLAKSTLGLVDSKDDNVQLWEGIESFVGEGKVVYGWEIDGEKIGFSTKKEWQESFLRYTIDYSKNSEFLKEWLKKQL